MPKISGVRVIDRRYFTFVFCCADFFVNRFRFRINNGRWSDTSEIRIPETNPFGLVINILSIKVAVWSVIKDGLYNYQCQRLRHERIEKGQFVIVIIIVQNIKTEISTQNNFVITISRINS